MADDEAFAYNGRKVEPSETQDIRYGVSEMYLGDPARVPVTTISGEPPEPAVFLFAAIHGDELSGIKVVREAVCEWDLADLAGTLACTSVMDAPVFPAQQQYLPIYNHDLNRSFPGFETSTGARRMARRIYQNSIAPYDLGIDFRTSTRGQTNTFHVHADTSDPTVMRLASAFSSHVIIDSSESSGMLRTEPSANETPAITVEIGEVRRSQRELTDEVPAGVESVPAEYGLRGTSTVNWPGWHAVISDENEKTWLRADAGGIIGVHHDRGALVHGGDRIYTTTNLFKDDNVTVVAPFTGLLVSVLENPVVYPGNPLCRLIELKNKVRRTVKCEQPGSPETTR